jgi:hypothetical protein
MAGRILLRSLLSLDPLFLIRSLRRHRAPGTETGDKEIKALSHARSKSWKGFGTDF